MKKPPCIVEQFDPMYGYDENGRWNGMTPAEVEVWLAEFREEIRRSRTLHRFDPRGKLPN